MKKIAITLIAAAALAGPAWAGAALEQLRQDAKPADISAEQRQPDPAPAPAADPAGPIPQKVYVNDKGCKVAVLDDGEGGRLLFVSAPGGRTATLAVGRETSSGRISAFCRPAKAGLKDAALTLSCGAQENLGYLTRGKAVLDLRGGLSALSVLGEVRVAAGWHTETEISCSGLRPRPAPESASHPSKKELPACGGEFRK